MYKNNVGERLKSLPKNSGITLIALVITIIVMLILVAVTISMAVNGGLFDYAGKAVGDTKNAINAEQELSNGAIQVDGVWYDSIDDYLNGLPEGAIRISYDYDKTEGLKITTVKLTFEIEGMTTLEEFQEEYLKDKTTKELEALFVKSMGYPGSFDNFLTLNNMTREQLKEEAEKNGMAYDEYLKDVIIDNDWIEVEYNVFLLGVKLGVKDETTTEELEELVVKTMNYEGSFDEFLTEQNMTRDQLEQMGKDQFGLSYEDTLKFLINQNQIQNLEEAELTVEVSNGITRQVPYTSLTTSFDVTENGTYKIIATGVNGNKGETTIEINSLYNKEEKEKFSDIYAETKTYTDKNGETAVIPKGYAVGISEEINAVNTGLVIRDVNGNEFVWVPVTGDLKNSYSSGDYYSEPKELTGNDYSSWEAAYDSQTTLNKYYGTNYYTYTEDFKYAEEYAEMVEKVNKYNGFYIGRYETTIDSEGNIGSEYNTNVLNAGTTLFTKNSTNFPYRWYGLYYEQKNADVTGNGTDVQTAMIYGVLYDEAMQFIRDQKTAGNTSYDVDTATASWHNSSGVKKSAQSSEEDVALNIWDLESNASEWTQEALHSNDRVWRGGAYNNSLNASNRGPYYLYPTNTNTYLSSRLALYIQ